jgi:ATP-dependent RNA helicase DDX35
MLPDGTYRSVRENAVSPAGNKLRSLLLTIHHLTYKQLLNVHPSSVLFTRTPSTNWVIYHEVIETTKSFIRDLTVIEQDWLVESA